MKTIRKEVRELINVNEKIHSAMARGERLTDSEKRLVAICASELIASMSNKQKRRFRDGNGARVYRGGKRGKHSVQKVEAVLPFL